MASPLFQIPELEDLEARHHLIRIPDQLDVPFSPRVRELVDTVPFRRLAGVRQLGLVSHVYPAAHHTRFEHSLGVFRVALLYLQRLRHESRFTGIVSREDAELFLVAALLHDLGHWPFCHLVEDLDLPDIPRHETLATAWMKSEPIAISLRRNWGFRVEDVAEMLGRNPKLPSHKLLGTMLSGPIDIDKMDYLSRDSLHAGVPYGRNFDQERLIGSLCLNAAGDRLAISEKGRTAAEMMLFARYVMFSEVYWHHAVRSASAMFQRAFYRLHKELDLQALFASTDLEAIGIFKKGAGERTTRLFSLVDGLFGERRRLYKQILELSAFQHAESYRRFARKPYPLHVRASEQLAAIWSAKLNRNIDPDDILMDAPPAQLEVQFDVDVHFPKEGCYRTLADVSPVVQALAKQQFDDYVKRVRIFVAPELRDPLRSLGKLDDDLLAVG
jgi:uncharacterized protein